MTLFHFSTFPFYQVSVSSYSFATLTLCLTDFTLPQHTRRLQVDLLTLAAIFKMTFDTFFLTLSTTVVLWGLTTQYLTKSDVLLNMTFPLSCSFLPLTSTLRWSSGHCNSPFLGSFDLFISYSVLYTTSFSPKSSAFEPCLKVSQEVTFAVKINKWWIRWDFRILDAELAEKPFG